jgi:hypothetical protein
MRLFVLTDHALRYFARPEDLLAKGVIPLQAVTSVRSAVHANATISMEVLVPGRTYLIRYKNGEERDAWVTAVTTAVGKARSSIVHAEPAAASAAPGSSASPSQQGADISSGLAVTEHIGRAAFSPYSSIFNPPKVVGFDPMIEKMIGLLKTPSGKGPSIVVVAGDEGKSVWVR